MVYYNKFKDVEVELPKITAGIAGEFRIEAFKGVEFPRGSGKVLEFAGTRRVLQDWHPNLVTNNGLDAIGGAQLFQAQWCYVGTGNTPPAATDTTMEAYVASAQVNASTPSAQSTPPYYGMTESRYLFNPGFGGGAINLNEIGVGTSSADTSLTARALTVDAGGTPTTVSVLADEYLECYYRRRNYPAHIIEATGVPNDGTGSVTIEGVSYGYTIRPTVVTYGGSYSVGTSVGWGTFMYTQQPAVGYNSDIYSHCLPSKYPAVLQAVTAVGPSNRMTGSYSNTAEGSGTYTTGTYSRELWYQWGISNANDAAGIGGLMMKTRLGAYQIVFDAAIPKVYGQVFTYYHNFSWAAKTSWV